jgi:hypothetical protein
MNEPFSFGDGSHCALAPVLSRASHVLNYFLLLPALSVARAVARGLFIRAETASSGSRIMTVISSHVTMLNQQVGV